IGFADHRTGRVRHRCHLCASCLSVAARLGLADERVDALDGLRGHAAAEAQSRHELAVVDGAPAERTFGHANALTEADDLRQERVVVAAAYAGRGIHSASSCHLLDSTSLPTFNCGQFSGIQPTNETDCWRWRMASEAPVVPRRPLRVARRGSRGLTTEGAPGPVGGRMWRPG